MIDFFSTDEFIEPESGDILISEPYLPDPNFERSVVLLCEHDEDNGSIGFVLNQVAQPNLADIIDEANGFESKVHIGGPVHRDTLHFIHNKPDAFEGDKMVKNGIYWGVDFDGLLSSLNTKRIAKDEVKFFVGYSGWSPGQLNEELKSKSWIVYKNVTPDIIFDMQPESLWKGVLARMGGKFKVIANYPTDPRLN